MFSLGFPVGLFLALSSFKGDIPVVFQLNTVLLEEEISIPNNTMVNPICPTLAAADFNLPFKILNQ